VTFDELGKYAFFDARFSEDGTPKEHPMNEKKYEGASILIVNRNFGCGSSREHAPQSLLRYGIRGILGESFAEIFEGNCTAIGLPVATADRADVENLMAYVKDDPEGEIKIDLTRHEAVYGDFSVALRLPEENRKALVKGSWDSTAILLSSRKKIGPL
jgi:3-isopropylmalate/(R)-2-methylmalate dehydratase small subunit